MRLTQTQRRTVMFLFMLALVVIPPEATAQQGASGRECTLEVQVCQVLTNVTGNGLTSQTLRGMNGWFQIIHQRLDDTELVMEGSTLTWNGRSVPDNPRIIQLAAPKIRTMAGEEASIAVGSTLPLQFMERTRDGLFEVNALQDENVGLFLSLNPTKAGDDGIMTCELSFRYSWVKEREKIDGVNLEIGRPVLGNASAEGSVQMRVGEWSCYQTPVDSEGWIFLFLRATQDGLEKNEQTLPTDLSKETPAGTQDDSAGSSTQTKGPKVKLGGSVQLRVGVVK